MRHYCPNSNGIHKNIEACMCAHVCEYIADGVRFIWIQKHPRTLRCYYSPNCLHFASILPLPAFNLLHHPTKESNKKTKREKMLNDSCSTSSKVYCYSVVFTIVYKVIMILPTAWVPNKFIY